MLSSQISQYSEPMETQQPSTSSRPMIIQQENVDDFQGYVGYVAQTSADNSDIPSYSTTTSNVATQETTFSTTIYNSAMPFPPQSGAMPMFAGMPGYNQFYQVAYQVWIYDVGKIKFKKYFVSFWEKIDFFLNSTKNYTKIVKCWFWTFWWRRKNDPLF